MANPLIPINTIRYKTYLKETMIEALRSVFEDHVDELLRKTKIDIDNPTDQESYPAIIVRFYERSITNAGVGHEEFLPTDIEEKFWQKFRHSFYSGDIEFAVYALSSYDRDLIADSLVQILSMGDTEDYTSQFLGRIYDANAEEKPTSLEHFVNVNTDSIQGFGETQTTPPWGPEDVLVYQTSYRIGVWGEFYSLTRPQTYVVIERAEQYPYLKEIEPVPDPNPEDPARWGADSYFLSNNS
jgi:hypothetical protein